MRFLAELIVVALVALVLPLFSCEAVFTLGITGGEAVCGHNGWIQVLVIFVIGLAVVIARFLDRMDRQRGKETPNKPWLKFKEWANREIPDNSKNVKGLGTPVLVLAYLFLVPAGLALFVIVIQQLLGSPRRGYDALMGLLNLGFVIWGIVWAYRLWSRGRRYGLSICRLITLPGVIGGWFKADVDCRLPVGAVVFARLENEKLAGGRWPTVLWSMGQQVTTIAHSADSQRSIVPVRLHIPRHINQKALEGFVFWSLKIEKKTGGDDFVAAFSVPIFDTTDAPANEQQPELSAPA